MDKVQIYYLALIIVNFLVTIYTGAFSPEKTISNLDRLKAFPITVALGIPIIGRVFNWW